MAEMKKINQVFNPGDDQPENHNGKPYTKFGVLVNGAPEKASLYGDKVAFVKGLVGAGEIDFEVVTKDDFFDRTKNYDHPIGYYAFNTWNLKWPYKPGNSGAQRSFGGGSGGGNWQRKPWSGGGGNRDYAGKAMPQDDFIRFCGELFTGAFAIVSANIGADADKGKCAEVAQSMFATMLIGMQKGMSYPTGYEPSVAAATSSTSDDTPKVDLSDAAMKVWVDQINECKNQGQCDLMRKVINEDTDLTEDQRVALRGLVMERQKDLA